MMFQNWLKKGGICIMRVHLDRRDTARHDGIEYVEWDAGNAYNVAAEAFKDKFELLEYNIETTQSWADGDPFNLAVWVWRKK